MLTIIAALLGAIPIALAQTLTSETVLGVYMLHRHGDRTPKILAPTNLTDLGYRQVYLSGDYYRRRYIAEDAPYRISGINADEVLLDQLQVSAPIDNVLQSSAIGFLQALYPPVGAPTDTETLRNGSDVSAPMQGYQLIPLGVAESGSGSEDSTWLQDTSNCAKAEISSNGYFFSAEYNKMLKSTEDFYQRLLPIIDGVFSSSDATFENAYEIFDFINVAEIHNTTIPHDKLLSDETLLQLQALANNHEWNLAYNSSEPIRSIAGSTLAAQVVQFLEGTIEEAGSHSGQKLGVQFGAYATFSAFFGLADLPTVNVDFTGVTNYASSMVFEMFTNASTDVTTANYPSEDDIYVRFMYYNGTATEATPPVTYPLFGSGQEVLSWKDFSKSMNAFAIGDTGSWCTACHNSTGICAPYATSDSSSSSSSSGLAIEGGQSCTNGLSPAVNGVIGAMVTLAVVLGIEALLMLVLGLRLVSKKRLAQGSGDVASNGGSDPKA